jgi:hypothetical protein
LLRAVGNESKDREEPLPDEVSTDTEEWDWLLEEFEDRIFWDNDFAMGDEFLDLPPDEAQAKLEFFRIDSDYYLTVPEEPDERGLTAARQTLARLLGLPVPDDDGLYPALDDQYHSLTIGPGSPDDISAWENNPWVQVIGMAEPKWDCDYRAWAANFSGALPATAFQLTPTMARSVDDFPGRIQCERRGNAWVVRDEHGWYWCDLLDNCWTGNPDDEDVPALSFPTEAEARAAFAQADQMYAERQKRHKQAMARLGSVDG